MQIARTISDRWLEAQALAGLGTLSGRQGDHAAAQRLLCEALAPADHIPLPLALDILAAVLPYSQAEPTLLAYLRARDMVVRIPTRAAVSAAWEARDDTTRSAATDAAAAYATPPISVLSELI